MQCARNGLLNPVFFLPFFFFFRSFMHAHRYALAIQKLPHMPLAVHFSIHKYQKDKKAKNVLCHRQASGFCFHSSGGLRHLLAVPLGIFITPPKFQSRPFYIHEKLSRIFTIIVRITVSIGVGIFTFLVIHFGTKNWFTLSRRFNCAIDRLNATVNATVNTVNTATVNIATAATVNTSTAIPTYTVTTTLSPRNVCGRGG
jgi:hypothetical protein